jgi:hypothetical protein
MYKVKGALALTEKYGSNAGKDLWVVGEVPNGIEARGEWENPFRRDPTVCGPDPPEAAEACRGSDRPSRIGAESKVAEPGRDCCC